MVLDLAVVMLPLPTLWALHMPIRRKLGISFIFSLGILTVGIMAWRIQSTVEATKHVDASYNLYITTLQSHLEIWLGIIGACLPTLAPLASKLLVPAFVRLVSPHRKLTDPSRNRDNVIRPRYGDIGPGVHLQKVGINRLDDESLVGFGDVAHWGAVEGALSRKDSDADGRGDVWNESPDAIIVRREYDVIAEPRHQI
ncbi:hypothetical protein ACLMJK_002766 [Lecanora helva]